MSRRLRQEVDRHGPAMSQMMVLGRLDDLGATTLTGLAAGERVRPQSMARTVDALETEGLITCSPHLTDGRRNVSTLTDTGRAMIVPDRLAREAWLARAMAAVLSPGERDLLVRAADRR
jgi:DNA-binding MarR family transcriptional regulator